MTKRSVHAKQIAPKFTEQFKQAFFEDIETRIKRADEFPSATDQRYIDRMIEMINTLVSRGLAYQADDKSAIFASTNFRLRKARISI
jgi:cysteinyl-tRNA synthetase